MKNRKGFLSKIIVLCLLLTIIVSAAACTQVVEFKVNFIVDGEIYKTINTAGEETISLPENPTKNGYIFDGWYWDEDVWSRPFTAESLLTEKLTADMSVYAKWITEEEAKIGVVSFETNGGSQIADIRTEKIETAPVSDKKGYILEGWYTNASLNGEYKVSFPLTVVNDMCLYAKWTAERYQIIYHTNGGTLSSDAICDYTIETSLTLPVPDNGNNIFVGWYDNAACEGSPVVSINKGEIGEKEFWAKWYLYNVSENADGSLTITSYSGGESIIAIPDTINGKKVTAIGASAFENCSILKSITIPSSITSIGSDAFSGCSSLEAVYITDMAAWSNISFGSSSSNPLYYARNLYLNGELVTELEILDDITSIGDYAFYNCSSLTSITIPDSITSIGSSAFSGCSSLENVSISENSLLESIGYYAFGECVSLTSITIPDSVKSIEMGAFAFCNSLESVIIGENSQLESIGIYAFAYCASLKDITIPDSVTDIGYGAFGECSSLTSITIPDGVTSIDFGTFYNCSSLTSITIPDSVTSIGDYAFYDCSSITNVIIPLSVTKIGESAFNSSNTTIYCESASKPAGWDSNWASGVYSVIWGYNNLSTNLDYDYIEREEGVYLTKYKGSATDIIVPAEIDGKSVIGFGSIFAESRVTNVIIENGIIKIDDYAFYDCSSLTSITIPDSVTSIGDYAFYGCSSIASIAIPDRVTSIGERAFYGCSSLTSITIPDSVTSIGDWVFYNCSSLTSITIPDSVTSIGSCAFSGCTSLTEIKYNAVSVEDLTSFSNVFYNAGENADGITVVFGESVERIPAYLFYVIGWSSLKVTSVTIGNNVTSIGSYAFYGCSLLTEINYNAVSVEDLTSSSNVFYDAGNNTDGITVVFGESVERIPANLFYVRDSSYRPKITSVTIGSNVTSIGSDTFGGCSSLEAVYITDIEAWCKISFGDLYSNPLCYAHNLYLNGELVTELEIPDGVTSIGDYAFYNCSSLTSITIPDSVTSIGDWAFNGCSSLASVTLSKNSLLEGIGSNAFYNCTSLTSITIPESVTSIGEFAFGECSSLTSITIPDSVTSIGEHALKGCDSLNEINVAENNANYKSLDGNLYNKEMTELINYACGKSDTSFIIPDGITSIGSDAFYNCSSLTSITIPDGVTSIGDWVFCNCSSLISITIPDSVTSIGSDAFSGCSSLISITIPDGVTSIGDWAFSGCSSLVSVTFGENSLLASIGEYAFYGCSSLASITIPDSVTSIGSDAFYNCSSLTIHCEVASKPSGWDSNWNYSNCPVVWDCNNNEVAEDGNVYYVTEDGIRYALKDGNATVVRQAQNLSGDMVIPSSVSYKDNVYNVTSIGSYAFSRCSSLTSITIPASVTSIDSSAFSGCRSLTIHCEVASKPSGWDSNWNYGNCPVIWDCNNNEVAEDGAIYYIAEDGVRYALKDGNATVVRQAQNLSGDIVIPSSISYKDNVYNVTSIGSSAFSGCSSLISITIPDGVTSIGSSAFSGCSSLASITIPDGVTSIGDGAFYNCSSLTSITIPDGVTSIGSFAFSVCSSLTSITIPESVTSIGDWAFNNCSSLTSITIPESVTSIGDRAFDNCSSLKNVYYLGSEQQWSQINIGNGNSELINVKIHYYSESEPSLNDDGTAYNGDYWRYVDGVPTPWIKEA